MSRLRPQRDSTPIPGSERTIPAAKIAEALGLKPAPPKELPIPDSPAAARLRSENKGKAADRLMESMKATHRETIVSGWPVAQALGLQLEDLPVGFEQRYGPPPKEARRDEGWSQGDDATVSTDEAADIAAGAEELRQRYRDHAAEVAARAESARGDAAKEAAAAAEVREVASIGERLKSKLDKIGLPL